MAPKRQRLTPSPMQYTQGQQKQSSRRAESQRKPDSRPEKHWVFKAALSSEDEEEKDFWEQKSAVLSEQAKLELRVFKRVHLQDVSEFTQAMNRIDPSYFRQFDIQHTRHVRMTYGSIFHICQVVDLRVHS
jgi:hypothetical protein